MSVDAELWRVWGSRYKVVGIWSWSLCRFYLEILQEWSAQSTRSPLQGRSIMGLYKRKITVQDDAITSAVHLTLRQSLLPNALGMFGAVAGVGPAARLPGCLLSHDSIFSLGIRLWFAGHFELALSDNPQYHRQQVQWSAGFLLRGLLHLPVDYLWVDRSPLWIPSHFHDG